MLLIEFISHICVSYYKRSMAGWQDKANGQVIAMDTRFDSPGKQMLLVCYPILFFSFVYLCAGTWSLGSARYLGAGEKCENEFDTNLPVFCFLSCLFPLFLFFLFGCAGHSAAHATTIFMDFETKLIVEMEVTDSRQCRYISGQMEDMGNRAGLERLCSSMPAVAEVVSDGSKTLEKLLG